MNVLFACDECGEDHIINSDTKEIKVRDKQLSVCDQCDHVSYEEDEINKVEAKKFDGFKWKCLICDTEMEEDSYTKVTYHL